MTKHEDALLENVEVTATFRPVPADWTLLSKASRRTIEAIYRHPLSHNLEWSAVVSLFETLGTVDHKPHDQIAFGIGGEHHRLHKPHGKDLSTTEVMDVRHMLTRAGWAPPSSVHSDTPAVASPASTDLLVVVDHHEARLYRLDIRSANPLDHMIKPHDPHHLVHTLSHTDHAPERGQRAHEDNGFYETIAQAISQAGSVVLIGHGKGHSNAAHTLMEILHRHHPETARKVVSEIVADLSSLTAPELLDLGRHAYGELAQRRLTAGSPASTSERPTP